MGIGDVSAYYLDTTRFTPSPGNSRGSGKADPGEAFSGLLSRAMTPPDPPGAGEKPVVDKTGKLYEQCEALETFLVKTLITGMRRTVQKSEFLGGGFAGQMYEDMLYDEYAKDVTRNAGFGLAELAYLELTGQRGKIRTMVKP
jgi:flagellar protein FlgJ